MARRPLSPRAARRARAREHDALVRDLEALAALEAGGSPERPLPIESPAQVEPIVDAIRCPLCDDPLRLDAHEVAEHAGMLLRVARVRCVACGMRRALYFRLATPLQ